MEVTMYLQFVLLVIFEGCVITLTLSLNVLFPEHLTNSLSLIFLGVMFHSITAIKRNTLARFRLERLPPRSDEELYRPLSLFMERFVYVYQNEHKNHRRVLDLEEGEKILAYLEKEYAELDMLRKDRGLDSEEQRLLEATTTLLSYLHAEDAHWKMEECDLVQRLVEQMPHYGTLATRY